MAGSLIQFGIAKSLQEKTDLKFYGLVDVGEKPKEFFKKQDLVNFEKLWYYRDAISLENLSSPDMNYLESIEKKYEINLWNLAYMERTFYKFNDFYKFDTQQILSILEKECHFFEKILDESKPDYIMMGLTDWHHSHLLMQMSKARGIDRLHLGSTRFGYRGSIYRNAETLDDFTNKKITPRNLSETEIIEYFSSHDNTKQINEYKKSMSKNKFGNKLNTILKFFFTNKNYQNHFSKYGRSKIKIISKLPSILLKSKYRSSFIEKHSFKKIEDFTPFVYYPLHSEPERAINIAAPFFSNQSEIIHNIAKSLPINYRLCVKEHPSMSLKGGRDVDFYKKLIDMPNVFLIHPHVTREKILKNCSLVITVSGTSALESVLFRKPSIVFTKCNFSHLDSIYTINSFEELPNTIKKALLVNVDVTQLSNYIDLVEKNTFYYNKALLNSDFYNRFYYRGLMLIEDEIKISEMSKFLEDHKESFDILANEHLDIIMKE